MPIHFLPSGAGMASLPLGRTFNEEIAGRPGTTSDRDSRPVARRPLRPAHTRQACNKICVIAQKLLTVYSLQKNVEPGFIQNAWQNNDEASVCVRRTPGGPGRPRLRVTMVL